MIMNCIDSNFILNKHSRNPHFQSHSVLIVMAFIVELFVRDSLYELWVINNIVHSTEDILHV
jgi:hypothetical protein